MSSEHNAKKGKDVNKVHEKKLRDYKKYKKIRCFLSQSFLSLAPFITEELHPHFFVLFTEIRVSRR